MVDIPNHEDSLRELSKTSLVNGVTVVLCWSAAEAARYLELYKSYENASFGAIRGQQASSYGEKLVEFVTVPRSLNKSDAVALVSNFGSLRNAVNADAEQLAMLGGWGRTKVKRWTSAVEEPFRVKKTAKRALRRGEESASTQAEEDDRSSRLHQAIPLSRVPLREMSSMGPSSRDSPAQGTPATGTPSVSQQKQFQFLDDVDDDDEEAMLAAVMEESQRTAAEDAARRNASEKEDSQAGEKEADLSGGVAAALAKLRDG